MRRHEVAVERVDLGLVLARLHRLRDERARPGAAVVVRRDGERQLTGAELLDLHPQVGGAATTTVRDRGGDNAASVERELVATEHTRRARRTLEVTAGIDEGILDAAGRAAAVTIEDIAVIALFSRRAAAVAAAVSARVNDGEHVVVHAEDHVTPVNHDLVAAAHDFTRDEGALGVVVVVVRDDQAAGVPRDLEQRDAGVERRAAGVEAVRRRERKLFCLAGDVEPVAVGGLARERAEVVTVRVRVDRLPEAEVVAALLRAATLAEPSPRVGHGAVQAVHDLLELVEPQAESRLVRVGRAGLTGATDLADRHRGGGGRLAHRLKSGLELVAVRWVVVRRRAGVDVRVELLLDAAQVQRELVLDRLPLRRAHRGVADLGQVAGRARLERRVEVAQVEVRVHGARHEVEDHERVGLAAELGLPSCGLVDLEGCDLDAGLDQVFVAEVDAGSGADGSLCTAQVPVRGARERPQVVTELNTARLRLVKAGHDGVEGLHADAALVVALTPQQAVDVELQVREGRHLERGVVARRDVALRDSLSPRQDDRPSRLEHSQVDDALRRGVLVMHAQGELLPGVGLAELVRDGREADVVVLGGAVAVEIPLVGRDGLVGERGDRGHGERHRQRLVDDRRLREAGDDRRDVAGVDAEARDGLAVDVRARDRGVVDRGLCVAVGRPDAVRVRGTVAPVPDIARDGLSRSAGAALAGVGVELVLREHDVGAAGVTNRADVVDRDSERGRAGRANRVRDGEASIDRALDVRVERRGLAHGVR